MQSSPAPLGKHYYSNSKWNEDTWIRVIGVEYESLVKTFDFNAALRGAADGEVVRLLDVGCGTAIFPRFLDPLLQPGLVLSCDLLDISSASIRQAIKTLGALEHFEAGTSFEMSIEEIPDQLPGAAYYDAIWAIHSFTTVDKKRMTDVFGALKKHLKPSGLLFIYQLTADSTYQSLHRFFANQKPELPFEPYMQFEDSQKILDEKRWGHEVYEIVTDHRIAKNDESLLAAYLQKMMLNDAIEPLDLFAPILDDFLAGDEYVFPQRINLIVAKNDV